MRATGRRRDPTTGEWRLFVAPPEDPGGLPPDHCRLCPARPGAPPTDIPLPAFDVVVLGDRLPATATGSPEPGVAGAALYEAGPAAGAREVVVYSDDHQLEVSEMDVAKAVRIVEVWADRYAVLGRRDDVGYVLMFEDRGTPVGAPPPHPHGLIQAYPDVPPRAQLELTTAATHLAEHGTCVFCDVVARELGGAVRIVAQNASFLAFVPFAARFPYEVHVTAHRHAASLLDLSDPERGALAALLKVVRSAYDRLFGFDLPYSMVIHQSPTDDGQWQSVSHFHIEFAPAHRTATELTHLGGSELGGGVFVNHVRPEIAAAALRRAASSG